MIEFNVTGHFGMIQSKQKGMFDNDSGFEYFLRLQELCRFREIVPLQSRIRKWLNYQIRLIKTNNNEWIACTSGAQLGILLTAWMYVKLVHIYQLFVTYMDWSPQSRVASIENHLIPLELSVNSTNLHFSSRRAKPRYSHF